MAKKSTIALVFGIFLFLAVPANAIIPNDPEYSKQQKMWQQIGAEKAWDYATGSNRVTVAIIDTGADIWHDDLKQNIWSNPYEIPDNNYDDDGNGYVDDIHGWNFIENNNDVRTGVLDNSNDPEAIAHGTVIAGLVGAIGNNQRSGTGLNWKVKIMPLRAIDSDGNGSYKEVYKAIMYAMNNDADVISLSVVGFKDDENLKNILRTAYDRGIVIVSAAGNDQLNGNGNLSSVQHYPVCMDNASVENWIIGVSSVDKNDKLSKFANYGSCVDLVAPGEDIFSTQRYAPVYGYDKEFSGPWQGTSFSVPLVAGAAALLKSFHPDWSAQNIISALLKSSDDISVKNPNFSGALGFGRLNVGQAMESSTVTFVSPDYSSLEGYYFKNDIIYIKKDEVNYFFAGAGEAKIIALGSTRSFNNKHDEVVVLVMRGKHYFVQFFNDQGKKWKEMAVPLGDYSNKKKPIKIKFLNDISGRKIQLEFLESIKKGNKKIVKKVTVKQYDWLDND